MAGVSPVVSVCVPTYNGSAFLTQTLQSIAGQTFQDYEVIIVDDHSSDDSVALARQYETSDPRVKVFAPSQRAGSSARNANRCLAYARGEWIKFIFQDDVMAPDCLSSLLDATRDNRRFALCWHDYHFEPGVDDQTRTFYETLPTLRSVLPENFAAADVFCEAVLAHWYKNFLGPTSSSFIHRECFVQYGGFNSNIMTFPDLECWVRMGSNEGVAIAPAYLVTFRVHQKSISARLRSSNENAHRNMVERVLLCLNLSFAPEYAAMRRHLRSRTPRVEPKQMLTKEAKDVRWVAVDTRYRKGDSSLLERWDEFVREHPRILDILREDQDKQSWMKRMRSSLAFWTKRHAPIRFTPAASEMVAKSSRDD